MTAAQAVWLFQFSLEFDWHQKSQNFCSSSDMDGFLQIVSQLALGAIALLVISGFSGLGFAFNRNNTTKIFSISNCKVQKVYRHTSKMMGGHLQQEAACVIQKACYKSSVYHKRVQ